MKWYVLHVLTGSEPEVKRRLMENGVTAVVLREMVVIRQGGKWVEQLRTVFPGYVFVYLMLTDEVYYLLKRIPGAIRLLPKGGAPMPLLKKDTLMLLSSGIADVLPLSRVDFSGAEPRIISGPLKTWEDYIVKIDRHRRQAQLRVPVLGEGKDVTLYIELA